MTVFSLYFQMSAPVLIPIKEKTDHGCSTLLCSIEHSLTSFNVSFARARRLITRNWQRTSAFRWRKGRELVQELFARNVPGWVHPGTDYIASFAPFNNQPTQYRITIDGHQKWFAQ